MGGSELSAVSHERIDEPDLHKSEKRLCFFCGSDSGGAVEKRLLTSTLLGGPMELFVSSRLE